MTDEQIEKALECCDGYNCCGCPYLSSCHQGVPMVGDALALIRRLKEKLDKAEECIWVIEDALDRGTDNDWAREAIEKYIRELTEVQR